MKIKSAIKPLAFLSFILFLSLHLSPQAGKGRINGIVQDEAGNPIEDAKITALSSDTKLEATTNEKGEWAILGLDTGYWRITANAEGYSPSFIETYIRQLRRNPKITFTLKKIAIKTDVPIIEDETSIQTFEQGIKLYEEKKYDEAITAFQEFIQKNPKVYQARINLGNCYKDKDELDKALEQFHLVLDTVREVKGDLKGDDASARALAAIGEIYLKKEDYEKAQSYLLKAIELYPKDEILAYNIGEIFFNSNKMDEAIKYFELAAQIRKDWEKPYLKLGYVYLNKTEYKKALENFNKFLEVESESPDAQTIRNLIPHLEGMIKKEEQFLIL